MEYNQNERADFNEAPNPNSNPNPQPTQSYQNFNNTPPPSVPPKNYLVESILITVLCCLPLGIVGIINATKVESLFAAGDYVGAQHAADEAKKWCKWGLIGGITAISLYLIFYIVFVVIAVGGGMNF